MKIDEILALADEGSCRNVPCDVFGIGKIEFRINGVRVEAQFHDNSIGAYCPSISVRDLFVLAGKLPANAKEGK